jgi:hypothetical protein
MRSAGHSATAESLRNGSLTTTILADYSDLFTSVPDPSQNVAEIKDLLDEMIDHGLAETEQTDTKVALQRAKEQLNPQGTPQGPGAVLRRLIGVSTTLLSIGPLQRAGQWASAQIMIRELAQVTRYISRGEDRLDTKIRQRLQSALGDTPSVVVSHSLGSVVAYETLHEVTSDVPLWVTIGSPLGMPTVILPRLQPQPPKTPAPVRRWLNYWDRDDFVAVGTNLAKRFSANDSGVSAHTTRVDSDGLNVHPAAIYLAAPAVAGPIAEAISSAAG